MLLDRRKNILIITDVFQLMAGSERNITQLLTNVDQKRFQLFVACFLSGQLAQDIRDQGFSVFDLRRGGIYSLNGLRNLIFLRKLVRENNINLIVTYHESSDFCGLILSRICNIPIVSSRRDMGYKTKLHHRIAYRLFGKFFDVVTAVSNSVKREIINRGWFPADKILPIYNGVDLREYMNGKNTVLLKERIGINTEHPVVGMIANLRKIKGIHFLIEAASIILKRNSDIEFLIIGEDMNEPGYTKDDLKSAAKNLNVYQNVHFLGKRTDIADLISIFDVAVVASLSEGFSNVVLEYMASSKPVVATNVGGNSEVVEHGVTGLLVPPGDVSALANAIWTILEDKETALNFGIAGRRCVEKKFGLDKMIKNYENLFEILSYY